MGFLTNIADKPIEQFPAYDRSCALIDEHTRAWLASGVAPTDDELAYLLHRGLAAMFDVSSEDMKAVLAGMIAALRLRSMPPSEVAKTH
ncbi:hypothetical protein [Burkholderia gladioli]|uniref:hypothetical protein n=1 Tax=Burkholderia gladioli TaxID=28095 RepID=UPI003EE1551A